MMACGTVGESSWATSSQNMLQCSCGSTQMSQCFAATVMWGSDDSSYVAARTLIGGVLDIVPQPEGHELLAEFSQLTLLVLRQRSFFRNPVRMDGSIARSVASGWALTGWRRGSSRRSIRDTGGFVHGEHRPGVFELALGALLQ